MSEHLKPIIEALIFASPEPLTPKTLFKVLETEPKEDVEAALALLRHDWERSSGLQLVEVAGGFQIVTRPELHEYVRRLFHERTTQKLSVQALETLAVIAYRQPITAPEITEIRGVNTSGVLNTLIDRKLVKIVGRKNVVGRPFMYATTREFLEKFGLNDISDLPKVADLADALGFEPPGLDVEPTATTMALDFGDTEGSASGLAADAEAPAKGEAEETSAAATDAQASAEGEAEREAEGEGGAAGPPLHAAAGAVRLDATAGDEAGGPSAAAASSGDEADGRSTAEDSLSGRHLVAPGGGAVDEGGEGQRQRDADAGPGDESGS
jgi:segregation and condensation protein B